MTTKELTKQFKKITELERELQQVKIAIYRAAPKAIQETSKGTYKKNVLLKAVGEVRNALWQKRYAKTIVGLS